MEKERVKQTSQNKKKLVSTGTGKRICADKKSESGCLKTTQKGGRPRVKGWSPALLYDRARRYFDACDSRTKPKTIVVGKEVVTIEEPNPLPYTIQGLCEHLDITMATFRAWRREEHPLYKMANKIWMRIQRERIEGALEGRLNGNFARFAMVNDFKEDYREKVEVENTVDEATERLLSGLLGITREVSSETE